MKIFISFILFLVPLFSNAAPPVNLVLVPGFFSSAIPAPEHFGNPWEQPYFSQDIVRHLYSKSSKLFVVDNLNPVGGVQENGQRLIKFLTARSKDFAAGPIVLLGHSAGGLYALYAAANSDLPIDHIITMSTPFKGLRLIDNLAEEGIPVASLAAPFCLENLMGLRANAVKSFLSNLTLKRKLRLDVFAGYQTVGLFTIDWRVLSAPLIPFQAIIRESSDGIVSVQSALNADDLLIKNKGMISLVTHSARLPIEHWEMILDADLTKLYGVLNWNDLRRAQLKVYSDVLTQSGY